MQGWIKLHRKIKSNPLYLEARTFSKFEAWLDLLLEVNHRNNIILMGSELMEVKRGEKVTSIRQLAERWKWSRTKVDKFLALLEKDRMIELKKDTKKTVITVVNYDVYQSMGEEERPQKRHEKDTEMPQKSTNKNVKNVKNINSRKQVYNTTSLYYQLAFFFLERIRENNQAFKTPDLQNWANDVRKMIEIDKRTEQQITYLMRWVQQDDFEKVNVLSPSKLRKRYDQLVMKVKQEQERKRYAPNQRPRINRDIEEHLKVIHGEVSL